MWKSVKSGRKYRFVIALAGESLGENLHTQWLPDALPKKNKKCQNFDALPLKLATVHLIGFGGNGAPLFA